MAQITTKTEQWPLERFKPDAEELARHDDPAEIRRLGQDMLERGQLQPVAALENGRFIFGHGRFLGAVDAGIKTLEVRVYPVMDETQFLLTRASENLQRKELTGFRKWRLCDALHQAQRLAGQRPCRAPAHGPIKHYSVSVAVGKCIARMRRKPCVTARSGFPTAMRLSKLPPEDQPGLLALKLSGGSRDALEQAGRKKRAGNAPAVRVPRSSATCERCQRRRLRRSEMTLESESKR